MEYTYTKKVWGCSLSSSRKLVEARARIKAKKPNFVRSEGWRYRRLKKSWRRAQGHSSKMRRKQRGWPKIVSVGYGSLRAARGLHPSGLREVAVARPSELDAVNPAEEAVRIAHTVGERKRRAILDRARELNLVVLNPGLKEAKVEVEGEKEVEAGEAEEVEVEKVEETEEKAEPEASAEHKDAEEPPK